MYTLSDFDFALPENLIAQFPLPGRSASRLLEVGETLKDRQFSDIAGLLSPGDLLVFNDTRVIRARLFGAKQSGGKIEVLIERITGENMALAHIRASRSPKPGSLLRLAGAFDVEVTERQEDCFMLRFPGKVDAFLEQYGRIPLPPYITREAESADETRYQTVYAKHPGAVAAPTAGLHFEEALLASLAEKGVNTACLTLHVGAGTFRPVKTEDLSQHRMHAERYRIPEETAAAVHRTRQSGGRIVAVGTTSLRALESASATGTLMPGEGETRLFITPGYRFHTVDRLITNFHLPKSTLLMLVCAFAGFERIRQAYRHAVARQYRFFSYGDAMLLDREK